jgi:hypothetical protein
VSSLTLSRFPQHIISQIAIFASRVGGGGGGGGSDYSLTSGGFLER